MKAIVHHEYGPPNVLELADIAKPVPRNNEVLVEVRAAAANAGDWHMMRADPFLIRLMFGGLFRPRNKVLGSDMAGKVEAVGSSVTQFHPGDDVFGDLSAYGFGAFAKYVCVPEQALVLKPETVTFEKAAAAPLAALAALRGLRDEGRIRPTQDVLINGASGGVGTFAVQIAKAFGSRVTGVCSTRNLDLVRSIGADDVIDYTQEDFTRGASRYDLIFDAAAQHSVFRCMNALKPHGAYVFVGGSTARFCQSMLLGPLISLMGTRKVSVLISKPSQQDLAVVRRLIDVGKVTPVIDRKYTLSEVPEAIRYLERGRARGKVVIAV